jgi:hypothetical protein
MVYGVDGEMVTAVRQVNRAIISQVLRVCVCVCVCVCV